MTLALAPRVAEFPFDAAVEPASAPAPEQMVSLDAVTVAFGSLLALEGVSFDIAAGEIVSLVGPSGSGKSTLLRVIAGIARPTHGRVRLDGVEVAGPATFVEPEHRRVGMVFQDYALFPHLTIADNVGFGLKGLDAGSRRRTVAELLERLGLERYTSSYPHMLSGGERQRVALARALAPRPRVLLMDEPFSGLDGRLRDRVRQETLEVLREMRTTTLIVTHDPSEAMRAADRLALLREGRLLQYGPVEEVYARPATAFAACFLSEVNELHATCCRGHVDTALGRFAAPHIPESSPVRVCIRPHQVRVTESPTGIRATVVSSEFLGESDRMLLEVPGLERPLCLRTSGRAHIAPGHRVFLDIDPSGVVVFPDDDRPS